jgi:hypothetical protein
MFPQVVKAQSASFTWNGSTDSGYLTEFATVNGLPVDQSTGYGGAIQIIGNVYLNLLELPQVLGFPNNGFISSPNSGVLTFGPKQWGTRTDGSVMNGTQAGDSYTYTGTTSITLFDAASDSNKTVAVSVTEFRQIVSHRNCSRYGCRTVLLDVMLSGLGTATIQ